MNDIKNLVKIRSGLLQELRNYLLERSYVEVSTPKISFMPTDQDDHLFGVSYFGNPAYLVQTPQFYKQGYVFNGIDSVFEIGPVFRAEPRVTKRHLSEFSSLDVESIEFTSLDKLMDFEEDLLREVTGRLSEKYEIEPLKSFEVVSYKDAQKLLSLDSSEPIVNVHEQELTDAVGKDGVFLRDYPSNERVFYYEDERGVSVSYDLIARGLEITSGGVRKTLKEKLIESMKRDGIDYSRYGPYLSMFNSKIQSHGGFGLGIERLISRLLFIEDIANVAPYTKKPNTNEESLEWKQ